MDIFILFCAACVVGFVGSILWDISCRYVDQESYGNEKAPRYRGGKESPA